MFLVVIDVRGIIRSLNLLSLTTEIESIVDKDPKTNDSIRFVLIVETVAEKRVLNPILPAIRNKKVCVIDSDRRVLFGDGHLGMKSDFPAGSTNENLIERMKYKLIRRVGHFKRPINGQHALCNQFFYDGQYCIDEIKGLIFNKVLSLKNHGAFDTDTIVYHCPESPWLSDAIYKANEKLRKLKKEYDLEYTTSRDLDEFIRSAKPSAAKINILFVVALVHTGNTFVEKYVSLKNMYPQAKITCLSILNVEQRWPLMTKNNTREINAREYGPVKIEFFLPVQQTSYSVEEKNCPMCNHDLMPKEIDLRDHLSSYEMWLICDRAGYKKEDFQPSKKRKLMEIMPDSLQLMRGNAAYLAYKFDKLLSSKNLNKSDSLILLHPNETSNKLELKRRRVKRIKLLETPSGYFAESLRLLRAYQTFSVPRDIIMEILGGKMSVAEIRSKHPEFFESVQKLPADIVIFDEVNVGGGTVSTIIDLLKVAKKKPLAYMPIMNFDPDKDIGIPVYSLYEFSYNPKQNHA